MKIAILSANLGNFDTPLDPVPQETEHEVTFHRFTDSDFPPISGLTPRLQYRIPKLFGWEMLPEHDIYIWLDSSVSLQRPDCVNWYLEQLGNADCAFFRHPWRGTVKDEVEHIEKKLEEGNEYITSRYRNGLHREFLDHMNQDPWYRDDTLYASTAFIYRNSYLMQNALKLWWYYQSRYFTCDQVQLPYVLYKESIIVKKIPDNLFKIGYLSLVSHHK